MTTNSVAQTILAQLGGGRFVAMTGARNMVSSPDRLRMDLPRNQSGANKFTVILEANDTYTLEFGSFRNMNYTVKATVSDVYADQLAEIFTARTGLYTRL